MIYQRRASALHAARASVGCAYCAALALFALVVDHPLLLAGAGAAVMAAGVAAGVGAALAQGLRIGLVLGALIVVVNALVSRSGLTVIARLGEVPVLGRLDITLEAVAYGAVQGLRAAVIVLCFWLYTSAIDPDEVLRLFRRLSFRSALTATLATRMVPVLARDARRMAAAQRSLPDGRRPPRTALLHALTAGALDRALDVAAALEVRGYGTLRRAAAVRRPLSRHDLAFAGAALGLMAAAAAARLGGLPVLSDERTAGLGGYGSLDFQLGALEFGLAGAVLAVSLLPFADRRGIVR